MLRWKMQLRMMMLCSTALADSEKTMRITQLITNKPHKCKCHACFTHMIKEDIFANSPCLIILVWVFLSQRKCRYLFWLDGIPIDTSYKVAVPSNPSPFFFTSEFSLEFLILWNYELSGSSTTGRKLSIFFQFKTPREFWRICSFYNTTEMEFLV